MNQFNIRVYGVLINEQNQVLISDERRSNFSFTKFPGGGLEFGEGIKDALIREFKEEMNLDIQVDKLFYFNEHLQKSAFNTKHQLISFYYFIKSKYINTVGNEIYTFPLQNEGEKQRWVKITNDFHNTLTFPIDKIVAQKLAEIIS